MSWTAGMASRRKLIVTGVALAIVTVGAAFAGWIALASPPPQPRTHPYAAHALDRSRWKTFSGSIEQRLPAGPYAYMRVQSEHGANWVVSLAGTSPPDGRVRVTVIGRADAFASRRLGRTFSPLLFGIVRPVSDSQLHATERNGGLP